jgi:hypothetical protein
MIISLPIYLLFIGHILYLLDYIYCFLVQFHIKDLLPTNTILIMLFGVTAASFLDNSFGTEPLDFYDIMDVPIYDVMDFFVYFLYPPFAYFFIYIYQFFHLKATGTLIYIIIWSLLSVFIENALTSFNVFTYKNGFNIYFLFLYLFSSPKWVIGLL